MEYTRQIKMTLTGNRVYVFVDKYDSTKWSVCLPGDLLDVTDKLTTLEIEKVKQRIKKEGL